MSKKRHTPKTIIRNLREAEIVTVILILAIMLPRICSSILKVPAFYAGGRGLINLRWKNPPLGEVDIVLAHFLWMSKRHTQPV